MSSLVARLHDAAVTPEAWPDALTALTDAAGVAGAALIIFNKATGKVDEAHFCGLRAFSCLAESEGFPCGSICDSQ